ncbi:hypothetical protein BG015_003474 [Linnemannia schmuckeri]|uniref:Uncharacterized protein n=1 Tax=Linnemannia schmuckeri TaxID=64567 RepID=A0A9P5VDD0_9FUNG|nr:hypothetical protein BG015_003474 [Linnemannia schmuckeri]
MSSQDYRVSTVAILCRDCGNDVGLYPGKHKCPPRPAMPAMPAIPAQYQQQQQSSYSSRGMNGGANEGRRPPDLSPGSLHSGGGGGGYGSSSSSSSRTPTSSSFQDRMAGGGSNARTPTAMSFQERLKERDREKQQREREEREAAARSVREDPRGDSGSNVATPTSASSTTTTGSLWNRLKAAKEVVTATITGEEKWPESDDSDHEGETHVSRILREYADKQEEVEMAKKIAELEMTPYNDSKSASLSKATGGSSTSSSNSGSGSRSQYLRDRDARDAARRDPSSSGVNGGADREDYYGRSLRARGLGGDGATSPSVSSMNSGVSNNSYGSSSSGGHPPASANRYRTTSDLSRDDALSRLEGKSQGDKLAAQVSHLGSTSPRGARATSPNPSSRNRDYQDNSSGYHQQGYGGQLSPSAGSGNQYSSSTPSQRSISPASNRRYDSPSPSGPPSQQGRYAAAPPPQPSSPSYPNNNNSYGSSSGRGGDPYSSRGQPPPQQSRPGPGQGGRPEYDRRPTYPPNGSGGPPAQQGNNLGAYGQRQQYQQYQQQQRQQQYSSNQANYF